MNFLVETTVMVVSPWVREGRGRRPSTEELVRRAWKEVKSNQISLLALFSTVVQNKIIPCKKPHIVIVSAWVESFFK